MAKRKSLFDDKSVEIQELTYIIKQDINSLNKQIGQLQKVSISSVSENSLVSFWLSQINRLFKEKKNHWQPNTGTKTLVCLCVMHSLLSKIYWLNPVYSFYKFVWL